jgi:hypothetical protein
VFRAAEIANFKLFVLAIGDVNEDVFRLDITMSNAQFVEVSESLKELVH